MKTIKKAIVTTTIYPPSTALLKYVDFKDWNLIVVGDTKTPHAEYRKLEQKFSNLLYLDPDDQDKKYPELSTCIGWKSIQRRNIGFVEAYRLGAEIIATIDDDNIPYDHWGNDLIIGKEIEIDLYESENGYFDPLAVTNVNSVWHRGYPLEKVPSRLNVEYLGKIKRKVLVQAGLWDGDPDIDAMARLIQKPIVKFDPISPYGSTRIGPFNSQNTFISREVLPFYAVIPHIGRMDDIWGSYILQKFFPNSVVYTQASVYQDRNEQDLITNLEKEILGYRETLKLLEDLDKFVQYLPEQAVRFWEVYRKAYEQA